MIYLLEGSKCSSEVPQFSICPINSQKCEICFKGRKGWMGHLKLINKVVLCFGQFTHQILVNSNLIFTLINYR